MEGVVTAASIDPAFWRGRRVLLTGHTGFKGAWLSLWLERLGAEVTGLSLPAPTEPSLFELTGGAGAARSITADLADLDAVRAASREAKPQIILHLAAQAIVRHSYRDPLGTLRDNVLGTANLLEAARALEGLEATIVVTSDKCYEGAPPAGGHPEGAALGGYDPYSASKACAEIVTSSWARSYGEELGPVATARAGNVIGGGDWGESRLLPDAVRATRRGEPLSLRQPDAVRPWQHVLDALRGYLMLAERLVREPDQAPRALNFGPDASDPVRVGAIASLFLERLGRGRIAERLAAPGPHENPMLTVDASLAREALGWRSLLPVRRAVEWTADWYRAWLEDESGARAATLAQIARFEGLA